MEQMEDDNPKKGSGDNGSLCTCSGLNTQRNKRASSTTRLYNRLIDGKGHLISVCQPVTLRISLQLGY